MGRDNTLEQKAIKRLYRLLDLQKEVEMQFGEEDYNVFVFGRIFLCKWNTE
ncbi:hypothetical protein AALA79_08695 [Lachnospiraceae bacterium 64-25]|nr:hypothetical protein IMSAGC005_01610 [Lachnospiraceae bacterium]